jgi:hypothetical protein
MQLQAQEKLSIENLVEKLDSQIVELRGLVLARVNNDSVLRTPSSAGENITNDNVNGQIASCFSSGILGGMNENISVNANTANLYNKPPVANGGLSSAELPLPLFDENLEINLMFRLKQLDEFLKLKGIPEAYQLAVAQKSLVGNLSRQWLDDISDKLKSYEDFRQAFLSTWCSPSKQSLVNCSTYQGKYDRLSNLTLSGHFLKYATMASHFEPRPSDAEVIEAIHYHFLIRVHTKGNPMDTATYYRGSSGPAKES